MKLSKVYEPGEYENDIYKLWEKAQAFNPKNRGSDDSFSIVIPPPNANGDLHLGHGLTLALEDIAVRYHRMKGEAALLLPGADHAGFETQVVYEKQLAKAGKSRFDFTREELYAQIWDFVAQNKENYESQFRRLGASLDWSRYTYTLDKKIIDTANTTFKKMWDDGLVYRGERLVNFCTFHGTGFADIEVAYKEEKGKLWHIKYPLTDGSGHIEVATTRPETMLGDTAVAVHPKDPRYKKFVGKTIKLPLTNREIPILADDMVDREFGTGAVKITPAHDPNDFEVATRHDLPMISVIDLTGKMTHDVPAAYRGLLSKDARKQIVQDLEHQGLLVKTEDHPHSVGHCYKCGTIIEPLLREQWFIDMQKLAKPAVEALKAKKIEFYPSNKRDQLIRYLQGLRDWNISRQIAWGIPIPAYQNVDDPDDWIFDTSTEKEFIEKNGHTYHRDPDVFDTWFSSGQWPYATLDFPGGKDFDKFYPLSLMETGADILFPWVSRMIMLGLYVTGEIPFKQVYLHGMIQDEHGAKMSKSKGNVVNPMEKIDQFGSDAFRMGIISTEAAGNNRPYDESKLIGARNFANKLWNVARFVEQTIDETPAENITIEATNPEDHWMLSKLQQSIDKVTADLENYRFAEAYETVYHTLWSDFADWYIEAGKSRKNTALMLYMLEVILKLTHPFAPFVTEAIWQTLHEATDTSDDSLLITASWPKADDLPKFDKKLAAGCNQIFELTGEIRYVSTNLKLSKPRVLIGDEPFILTHKDLLQRLAKTGDIVESDGTDGLKLTGTRIGARLEVTPEQLQAFESELKKKLHNVADQIKNLETRLKNKSYVQNAPEKLVAETHQQLTDAQEAHAKTTAELKRFSR